MTARELERQVNHPAQKRWVEILQIAPDSSLADIMQAQQEQMDRFSAGKEGQENGLPDEASAEDVKELESDWLLRRLQLQQGCQI